MPNTSSNSFKNAPWGGGEECCGFFKPEPTTARHHDDNEPRDAPIIVALMLPPRHLAHGVCVSGRKVDTSLPKIIWMYWRQGFDNAPPLVRLCLASWQQRNPGWTVAPIDEALMRQRIQLPRDLLNRNDISVQKYSNIYRLMLLEKFGGIWVDATVFCHTPLDAWIEEYARTGFFTFRHPGKDRLISNWFIASWAEHALLREMNRRHLSYWTNNYFGEQPPISKYLSKKFKIFLSKNAYTSIIWTTPIGTKILRTYPYFIFHYIFNRIVLGNKYFKEKWMEGKSFSADMPHMLQTLAHNPQGAEKARELITITPPPVSKLDWRAHGPYWDRVLQHLAQTLEHPPSP